MDSRAVLEGRDSGRTPVPLIIGLTVASLCVLASLALYARQPNLGGPGATIVGILFALPSAGVMVAIVLLIDRLEPEPRGDLVFAFAWGAGIAALAALILNTLSRQYLTVPAFGATEGTFVSAAIVAPIVEESVKGAALLALLKFRSTEIDGPTDGIVYAALVGTGFALTENVNYYMQGLHQGGAQLAFAFVLRGVIAPMCHPLFTAMTGLGVAYAANHRRNRRAAVACGLVAAMLLHGAWNGSSAFGWRGIGVVYGVLLLVLVALAVVVVKERRRLVVMVADHLPGIGGEPPAAGDLEMLSSLRGRRLARQWARLHGGMGAARAMADYQLAATELALAYHKRERAMVDEQSFARRRDALVELMEQARGAFFRRRPDPPRPPWAGRDRSRFGTSRHLPGEDLPGQGLPGDDLFGSDR